MFDVLTDPLAYPFMQRAMIEVLIVGFVTGLVGAFVVLRGLSFIGDALVHAVFPGVVIATILGWNIMAGAFLFGAATALSIGVASRNERVGHDAAIGVVFAAFFALGIVLISARPAFGGDLASILFGNILGISDEDIIITGTLALGVALVVLALGKEFVLLAFDRTLAHALGYPVFALELLLLLLVTVTVVVSLQTIGNLLVLALLVTPAAAARLLTDRLLRMIAFSILIAMASGVIGLYVSYHADISAGGSIALTSTACFLLALAFSPQHGYASRWVQSRRGEHHAHHFHEQHEEPEIR